VRGIVLVALLAAVGGVLSTYIGYLGNLVNRMFGVPFGAGQLIAGLHIVWPLLARIILGRLGSGTMTGALKGLVEFLSGSTHGVVIVLVSLIEGLLVDLGLGMSRRVQLPLVMLVGAVASASNVFIFQAIYFSGVSVGFILVMAGLSAVSGALLGGYVAWDLHRLLSASRLLSRSAASEGTKKRKPLALLRNAVTGLVVMAFLAGGATYYIAVYDPFTSPGEVRITGAVESEQTFRFAAWSEELVTIHAELRGSVTSVPAQDYTGVPLRRILELAVPSEGAQGVRVIADDGYEASFDLLDVLADSEMLLILDEGRVRLVAANYDGGSWVRRVTRIVVD